MVAAVATTFVACDDDDEEELAKAVENELESKLPTVGLQIPDINQDGYTIAESQYFKDFIPQGEKSKISLHATEDAHIEVTYESNIWGTATFHDAQLKNVDGAYTITATDTIAMKNEKGGVSNYLSNLSCYYTLDSVSCVIEVPGVMNVTKLLFTSLLVNLSENVKANLLGVTKANSSRFENYVHDQNAVDTLNILVTNTLNQVNVEYKSSAWGESTTFTNANVEKIIGGYKITGKSTINLAPMGQGEVKEYNCELEILIFADGKSSYVITLPDVMQGGTTLTFEPKE